MTAPRTRHRTHTPPLVRTSTSPTPFTARRSLQLDQVIVQLDAQPGTLRTAWLRLQKRLLEPRIEVQE